MWPTTISLEFTSETEEHLKDLGHRLKAIHHVEVSLVEPVDPTAPALIAIGLKSDHKHPLADLARQVAQTLYSFLHEGTHAQGQQQISLVTIEGQRINFALLTIEDITRILIAAQEGKTV